MYEHSPVEFLQTPKLLDPTDSESPLVHCFGQGQGEPPFFQQEQAEPVGSPWCAANALLLGRVDPRTGVDENGRRPVTASEFLRIAELMLAGVDPDTGIRDGVELNKAEIDAIVDQAKREPSSEESMLVAYLNYDAKRHAPQQFRDSHGNPIVPINISELQPVTDSAFLDKLLDDPTNTRDEFIVQYGSASIQAGKYALNSRFVTFRRSKLKREWYAIDGSENDQIRLGDDLPIKSPLDYLKKKTQNFVNSPLVRAFVEPNVNDPLVQYDLQHAAQVDSARFAADSLFDTTLNPLGLGRRVVNKVIGDIANLNPIRPDDRADLLSAFNARHLADFLSDALDAHNIDLQTVDLLTLPERGTRKKWRPSASYGGITGDATYAILHLNGFDTPFVAIARGDDQSPWRVIGHDIHRQAPALERFIETQYQAEKARIKKDGIDIEEKLAALDEALEQANVVVVQSHVDMDSAADSLETYCNDWAPAPFATAAAESPPADEEVSHAQPQQPEAPDLIMSLGVAKDLWSKSKNRQKAFARLYALWENHEDGGLAHGEKFQPDLILMDITSRCRKKNGIELGREEGGVYPDVHRYPLEAWGATFEVILKHDETKGRSIWLSGFGEEQFEFKDIFDNAGIRKLDEVLTSEFLTLTPGYATGLWKAPTQSLFKLLLDILQKRKDDGEEIDVELDHRLLVAIAERCRKRDGVAFEVRNKDSEVVPGFFRFTLEEWGSTFNVLVRHDGQAATGMWLLDVDGHANDMAEVNKVIGRVVATSKRRQETAAGINLDERRIRADRPSKKKSKTAGVEQADLPLGLTLSPAKAQDLWKKGQKDKIADVLRVSWNGENAPTARSGAPVDHYLLIEIAKRCRPGTGTVAKDEMGVELTGINTYQVNAWGHSFSVLVQERDGELQNIRFLKLDKRIEHDFDKSLVDLISRNNKDWHAKRKLRLAKVAESADKLDCDPQKALMLTYRGARKTEFAGLFNRFRVWKDEHGAQPNLLVSSYLAILEMADACGIRNARRITDPNDGQAPAIYNRELELWGERFNIYFTLKDNKFQDVRLGPQSAGKRYSIANTKDEQKILEEMGHSQNKTTARNHPARGRDPDGSASIRSSRRDTTVASGVDSTFEGVGDAHSGSLRPSRRSTRASSKRGPLGELVEGHERSLSRRRTTGPSQDADDIDMRDRESATLVERTTDVSGSQGGQAAGDDDASMGNVVSDNEGLVHGEVGETQRASIQVVIKRESDDDEAISSAPVITDPEVINPEVQSAVLDEVTQRRLLSWKVPLLEEVEEGFQTTYQHESMEMSDEPPANFLWPIRDPRRPSRIHPDYAADEDGLILHENCECREVFIHYDERKKIVAAYEETRQEANALSGGTEADKRERILASYVDVKNDVAQFFGGINPERMEILESYVKAKKELEKLCTGIYIEEGQEKIAEYEKANDYRSEIDVHVAPSERINIEAAYTKAKTNLALFLAGGIDRHERKALLELYAEARRDPGRFVSGMDADERKGLMARYEHRESVLRSYAEVEKGAERLFTDAGADEKKNLLAAHVKAKTRLKRFFAEIDPHERERLLALYAEVKRNREGFFPGAEAAEKADLSKMYAKKEKLLAAYAKADATLERLFTSRDAVSGKTMLKRHKEAEARLDEYFTEREAKIKEIWDYAKEGKAAPAAQLFHTPRLTDQTTRSKKLVGEFGRRLLDHDNQPLLEAVDAWVYVKIDTKDLKALEAFVDKYGKDRFENYAMRGSEDNEGNSYYFVPVKTGHPSALMNDEYPPVDQEGKIVPGKQRGDMMSFEAEVGLTNKFRRADGMQSPHTLQHRLTEAPYETTMGYTYTLKRVDEYWLDRHDADALDSHGNFNAFYAEVGRRFCGRSLMVDWRKKSGQNTNEAFLRDVVNNCKEVMSEPRVDGRNPKLVEGEWGRGEFKVWENWHIKGFKTTIAERPVTVFLSFNDRMGTRIDDIRILEEQTPTRESYQAMFNEMRSKAVVRLCQETRCLPGFSLALSPQVKQEPPANAASMQQAGVETIPMRGGPSTSRPQPPAAAGSSHQTKGKNVPGRGGR
ncbi:MAG TPA: hypothetical protein VM532_11250 [Burkholderiales bacterium]|nr:hypothetical protein [Burkholderiales bacterium]